MLQAISSEPAVMHAVLALSSAHKKESLDSNGGPERYGTPDSQELYALRQYNEAMISLRPHFSTKDKSSLRVALITCAVFICLEFLRGHYRTGNNHLRSGMRILNGMLRQANALSNQDSIDDWLIETFCRLNTHAALLGHGCSDTYLGQQSSIIEHSLIIFNSMNQARSSLDRLLNNIVVLTEDIRREGNALTLSHYLSDLVERQKGIQIDLASWWKTYKASKSSLLLKTGALGAVSYQLLHIYYTMAHIMVSTCFRHNGEFSFDSYIEDFVAIINLSAQLYKIVMSLDLSSSSHHHVTSGVPFVADIGWIAPLYFTALKCRNHRVRLQAIRSLESVPSRQGIWNALIVASVAQKVMELEEMDFYKDVPLDDNFALDDELELSAIAMLTLPQSHRMQEVQIVLPDTPLEETHVACKRRRTEGNEEVTVHKFYVSLQHIHAERRKGSRSL